ncbi:MAG: universal stress protein [Planctomycetaceae bacterium]|nr:universal stress protein [Planctomycetaceae bacterium]
MIQIPSILVPIDFSPYGDQALKYGCALAGKFGSQVHLLHVVDDYYPFVPEASVFIDQRDDYLAGLRTGAERELVKMPPADWRPADKVTRTIVVGTPFVEIVRYAKEHDIGLIVIGSHGRGGLSHVLMGSVAERVVRKAPCPVLTVRPGQHEFVLP